MLCDLAPLQQEELSPYHCFIDFCKYFYANHQTQTISAFKTLLKMYFCSL